MIIVSIFPAFGVTGQLHLSPVAAVCRSLPPIAVLCRIGEANPGLHLGLFDLPEVAALVELAVEGEAP